MAVAIRIRLGHRDDNLGYHGSFCFVATLLIESGAGSSSRAELGVITRGRIGEEGGPRPRDENQNDNNDEEKPVSTGTVESKLESEL